MIHFRIRNHGGGAKRFSRRFIGIEQSKEYVEISRQRLQTVQVLNDPDVLEIETKRNAPRVPFGSLLDRGLVNPGELMFDARRRWHAKIRADGLLISESVKGSIHAVGAAFRVLRLAMDGPFGMWIEMECYLN